MRAAATVAAIAAVEKQRTVQQHGGQARAPSLPSSSRLIYRSGGDSSSSSSSSSSGGVGFGQRLPLLLSDRGSKLFGQAGLQLQGNGGADIARGKVAIFGGDPRTSIGAGRWVQVSVV